MSSTKDSLSGSRNYRKPPVEHQFKKGRSGNPKGRPKKKLRSTVLAPWAAELPIALTAMALDEATRPVTVREGDKVSEIPAMQALLRTLIRSGAQGDTKAARQVLELIARAEMGGAGVALEFMQQCIAIQANVRSDFRKTSARGP